MAARLDKNWSPLASDAKHTSNEALAAAGLWPDSALLEVSVTNRGPEPHAKGTHPKETLLPQNLIAHFPQLGFSEPVDEIFAEERERKLEARTALVPHEISRIVPEFPPVIPTQSPAPAPQPTDSAAEVARLRQRLAEHNRDLETICSALMDTLGQPLRSMAGSTQLLLVDDGRLLNGSGKACAQRVAHAADRLNQLVDGLLQYIHFSRLEPVPEIVSLDAAVCAVVGELSGVLASHHAEVQIQRPLANVLAQPALLRQVICHLIENALKFVAPEATPQLRIWNQTGPTSVRVYVEDNGIGVPPEHGERIFGLFHRLNDSYPGTGIGLALVRKAVERMNGRTGVDSVPGKGSRFWIELPKHP